VALWVGIYLSAFTVFSPYWFIGIWGGTHVVHGDVEDLIS
jgi:hypothetical protein